MPNLELSPEELRTLHDAIERYMEMETRALNEGGDEARRALFDRAAPLYTRLHNMLAWGTSGAQRILRSEAAAPERS